MTVASSDCIQLDKAKAMDVRKCTTFKPLTVTVTINHGDNACNVELGKCGCTGISKDLNRQK